MVFYDMFQYTFSPRLYRTYNRRSSAGIYVPNRMERYSDNVIFTFEILWGALVYVSPIFLIFGIRRGVFDVQTFGVIVRYGFYTLLILASSLIARCIGRSRNFTYVHFHMKYKSSISDYTRENKMELQNYDFEFSAVPVDFEWKDNLKKYRKNENIWSSIIRKLLLHPTQVVRFLCFRSVGIRLMYPGSVLLFSRLIQSALQNGRRSLIETNQGERFKLKTPFGHYLDSFYVDRRKKTDKGKTLVICTEGNAGFYEIGIMSIPIHLGYSALGWNHPGFAHSTGMPFVDAERAAIDTVMQFAIEKLKFTPDNIVLFGWSIGGFCSTYAASLYPDVKAIVLDATFDEIVPIAVNQLNGLFSGFIESIIRENADLNVSQQLNNYNGPVVIIRRTEDEIISVTQGDISSNRANDLLYKLLQHRYPKLFDTLSSKCLRNWLSVTVDQGNALLANYRQNDNVIQAIYGSHKQEHGRVYPSDLGHSFDSETKIKMILYLANLYMKDFAGTHCQVLEPKTFETFVDWEALL